MYYYEKNTIGTKTIYGLEQLQYVGLHQWTHNLEGSCVKWWDPIKFN
jgi:hypothetical protein